MLMESRWHYTLHSNINGKHRKWERKIGIGSKWDTQPGKDSTLFALSSTVILFQILSLLVVDRVFIIFAWYE